MTADTTNRQETTMRALLPGHLKFIYPLPGLEVATNFDLFDVAGVQNLYALRSSKEDSRFNIRLFLLDSREYFFDYRPEVPLAVAGDLKCATALEDLVILSVLHPGQGVESPTANLLAPIVVNPGERLAAQIVLEGQAWPLRAPLVTFV